MVIQKKKFRNIYPSPGNENIEDHLKEKLKKYPELNWERLKEEPALAPGNEEIAFADLKFKTPSGKIEIFSKTAQEKWGVNPLPTYEPIIKEETNKKENIRFNCFRPIPKTAFIHNLATWS